MIREVNQILAENHQKYKVFAILLFTDNHPYIIKMLKDDDFWNVLDRISGEDFPIITTTLFTNSINKNLNTSFYHMLSLLITPNENIEILNWFDIHSENDLPQLVLFGEDNKKLYYSKYKLAALLILNWTNFDRNNATLSGNKYQLTRRYYPCQKNIIVRRLAR